MQNIVSCQERRLRCLRGCLCVKVSPQKLIMCQLKNQLSMHIGHFWGAKTPPALCSSSPACIHQIKYFNRLCVITVYQLGMCASGLREPLVCVQYQEERFYLRFMTLNGNQYPTRVSISFSEVATLKCALDATRYTWLHDTIKYNYNNVNVWSGQTAFSHRAQYKPPSQIF